MTLVEPGDIGRRIKVLRESKNIYMRQVDFIRELNKRIAALNVELKASGRRPLKTVTASRVSNWEGGKHDPEAPLLKEIAQILNISQTYLLTGEPESADNWHNAHLTVLGVPAAFLKFGGYVPADTWTDPFTSTKTIRLDADLCGENRFGLELSQPWFAPFLLPNDILVFEKYPEVGNRKRGHVVLAKHISGCTTLQELDINGGDFILRPITQNEPAVSDSYVPYAFLIAFLRTRGEHVRIEKNLKEGLRRSDVLDL